MKTVRDVMSVPPIWVNPFHTVRTALILLTGHGVSGLPVLQGDDLVGLVEYPQLVGVELDAFVSSVMRTDAPFVSPDTGIKQVAEMLSSRKLSRVSVVEAGRLVGVVSAVDLLSELGRSYDPLTELPWADTLREWSIEALAQGREISILFFDLNHFGQFNKDFGHLVGDRVLKTVAKTLLAGTDIETDLVCRYGGDEFSIACLRRSDDAAALAERLQEQVNAIKLADVEMAVSTAYGLAGGKRTREREHVHYAATLDNLINRASHECLAMKQAQESVAEVGPDAAVVEIKEYSDESTVAGRTICIESASHVISGQTAQASVTLLVEGRTTTSTCTGAADCERILSMVAQATATALRGLLAKEYGLSVEIASVQGGPDHREYVTVVVNYITPSGTMKRVGSALVDDDPCMAAASALLAAVCRDLDAVHLKPAPRNPTPAGN